MTVAQIQLLLTYLGYAPGAADGIAGKMTRAAVRAFQKAAGIGVDGIAGAETQKALKEAVCRDRFRAQEERKGDFWKNIRYFSRNEPYIACPCGACGGFPAEPTERLMRLADRIREQAGGPMIPSSTVRCPTHNAAVCGVANSRHLTGRAMDFSIRGWPAEKTLALVRRQKEVNYAYAIDGAHVHMDVL